MKVKLDKNMEEFLAEFELSDREVAIYITLLQTGPNTIMNLARETGIKRSTTHNNVEELIKKGLVSQTNYGERRMVVAESPDKLQFLLDQKKFKVQKLEKNLPAVIEQINSMVPEGAENTKVEVKYYEGKDNVQSIYRDAFESKELRSYVNLASVARVFPDNSELYLQAQKKNPDLITREIVDDSTESRKVAAEFEESANFDYRISNGKMNLSSIDVLIFGDKVAMINFNDNISATVIQNKDYSENSKAIFDLLWQTLTK